MIVDDDLFQELLDRVAALERKVAQLISEPRQQSVESGRSRAAGRRMTSAPKYVNVIVEEHPPREPTMVTVGYKKSEPAEPTLA